MAQRLYVQGHRLHYKKDIQRLMKRGKFLPSEFFVVRVLPNDLMVSRYAVLVGKKVAKKAVERNTIKRRIREILRTNIKTIRGGVDIAVIAAKPSNAATFQDLHTALLSLMRRHHLLKQ